MRRRVQVPSLSDPSRCVRGGGLEVVAVMRQRRQTGIQIVTRDHSTP